MPGLVHLVGLVRPVLDAPRVGADRRDLLFLAPIAILEFYARRIAAGIAAPFLLGKAALHLAGAKNDEVARLDAHALLLGGGVEFVIRNAITVLEPIDAFSARDVEQHAAADHLVARMLDAEHVDAAAIDARCAVAVIGLAFLEDVGERIPMRRRLDRHVQRIIGIFEAPAEAACDRVGAGREHGVDRIPAYAEETT